MVTNGLNSYIKYENLRADPILLLIAVRTYHFLNELSFQEFWNLPIAIIGYLCRRYYWKYRSFASGYYFVSQPKSPLDCSFSKRIYLASNCCSLLVNNSVFVIDVDIHSEQAYVHSLLGA